MTDKDEWARCGDCQRKLGGIMPDNSGITCHMGTCPRCNKEQAVLIPTSDYNWPDGRKAIWD